MHVRSSLAAAALAAALLPVAASATVPPRNCGPMKVAGRSYIIKADQLRCTTAKTRARAYLVSHRRPRGFTCRDYRNTAMTFRCNKGVQVFFAIRR
jgi:hypothetical protein